MTSTVSASSVRSAAGSTPARPSRLRRPVGRVPKAPRQYYGGQTHTGQPEPKAGQTVCIDWLRMSGPSDTCGRVQRLVSSWLGTAEPGGGRFFLAESSRWGAAGLYWSSEGRQTHAVLDLPAGTLREIGATGVMELMQAMNDLGWKGTRVDLALDFWGRTGAALIEQAAEACENDEVCGARAHQVIRQGSGRELTGHGVNIGARGSMGSGRYTRIYDKGLEQKSKPQGEWVRWELELTSDCAAEAVVRLLADENTAARIVALCLGAVEFRENTGDPNKCRRPLLHWWAELIEEVNTERVMAVRAKSTAAGYARWLRKAVVPKLATTAAAASLPMAALLVGLVGEINPRAGHLKDPKVRAVLTDLGVTNAQATANLESLLQLQLLAGGLA